MQYYEYSINITVAKTLVDYVLSFKGHVNTHDNIIYNYDNHLDD